MAIDTAAKRRSVAGIKRAFFTGPRVTPNAAKPLFWRQCVARIYGGIATGAAAAATFVFNYILFARRRGRR